MEGGGRRERSVYEGEGRGVYAEGEWRKGGERSAYRGGWEEGRGDECLQRRRGGREGKGGHAEGEGRERGRGKGSKLLDVYVSRSCHTHTHTMLSVTYSSVHGSRTCFVYVLHGDGGSHAFHTRYCFILHPGLH